MIRIVAIASIAFLLGSVPSGYLLLRWRRGQDVRRMGSGNIGSTNVYRAAGPAAALATLVLDAAKGAIAVLIARAASGSSPRSAAIAALAAVLGNAFCPWLGFRGGKGVATACGALGLLAPGPTACAVAAFVAVGAVTGYVSAGSAAAVATFPAAAGVLRSGGSILCAGLGIAAVVIWRHRDNWSRWRRGSEPRWWPRGPGSGKGNA